jgi:hypothetical protein
VTKYLIIIRYTIALISLLCFSACGHKEKDRSKISFKSIEGITYLEVSRLQKNGLSYNDYGFHLSPDWKLRFVSEDSAALYSPVKKQFLNFPLALGTDSVFNTAHAFLKMKHMSKDSLVLELLEAAGDSINLHKSRVTMRLFSEDYIKNKLHTDIVILQRPSRKDTLFVRSLVEKANADIKKAFAASEPVKLMSRSPQVTVAKRVTKPSYIDNNFSTDDDYLDPTFDIVINKAYANFNYSFSAYVDSKGQMFYRMPLIDLAGDDDFKNHYIKMSTGIMNSYLKLYLTTIPGQTLGMPHTSTISIHVTGTIAAKQ